MNRPDPERPVSSDIDALVHRIVMNELETLQQAFSEGAEFAVAGSETAKGRVSHRLECPVLEPQLDRHSGWDDRHRSRLAATPISGCSCRCS